MSDQPKTICFDFDGVIHSYTSGWTGPVPTDPPVPDAREIIEGLIQSGVRVVICSARAGTPEGFHGIKWWLRQYNFPDLDVVVEKPPADVYIDDRAVMFDGNWNQTLYDVMHMPKQSAEDWPENMKKALDEVVHSVETIGWIGLYDYVTEAARAYHLRPEQEDRLRIEMDRRLNESANRRKQSNEGNPVLEYTCPECNRYMENGNDLTEHLQKKHDWEYNRADAETDRQRTKWKKKVDEMGKKQSKLVFGAKERDPVAENKQNNAKLAMELQKRGISNFKIDNINQYIGVNPGDPPWEGLIFLGPDNSVLFTAGWDRWGYNVDDGTFVVDQDDLQTTADYIESKIKGV